VLVLANLIGVLYVQRPLVAVFVGGVVSAHE
jgi:hypothetical protein